jgi:hypothetical protein
MAAQQWVGASEVVDGIWKYVVHDDGSVRFAAYGVGRDCPSHAQIRDPARIATRAGMIGVQNGSFVVASASSETLHLSGDYQSDTAFLKRVLTPHTKEVQS